MARVSVSSCTLQTCSNNSLRREGFVKLFTSPGTGVILGGVIVAPRASELILAVSVAMEQRLTAEQLAQTFTVYPSLSGSVTETARRLMEFKD